MYIKIYDNSSCIIATILKGSEVCHCYPPPPAVSGAAQIIGDLVTGRAAESFSHYQPVAYDDSEGIGKV